jgi:Protein of unknown function (DUF3987)
MGIARGAGFGRGKLRYPHSHDLLIGESGITHKNTSIGRMESIIKLIRPEVLVLRDVSSIEGALQILQNERKSIGLIASEEYSYWHAASQRKGTANMNPVANHCYDGVEPLTITRNEAISIPKPFVNMVAGSTPDWITGCVDKEGADLGRFNRFMVFQAEQERDVFDPDYLTPDEEQQFAMLFNQSLGGVLGVPEPIALAPQAHEWLRQWFLAGRRLLRSQPDHLRKLMERDEDQAKIQALIYAVADGRRVMSLEDVQAGAALVDWSRENKMRLFGEVEFNADQPLERRMLKWIARGGGTMTQLYRFLGRDGTREPVHRKLRALAAEGAVILSRPLDPPSREPLSLYPLPK